MKVKVVKCSGDYWYKDKIGTVYSVEHDKGDYMVIGEMSWIKKGDAELLEDKPKFPFKVRCINNSGAEEELCVGHVYEVLSNYAINNYALKDVKSCWHQDRFEILKDEPAQISLGSDIYIPDPEEEKLARNKYMREVKPGVFCDVYDILRAWEVTDPCLQHLLKKALQPGKRHHKDLEEDLKDILASAKRAVEMYEEWNK